MSAFLPDAQIHEISREQSIGYDTNALQVGHTVIAPTTLSEPTEQALDTLGLAVVRVDLGELFVKGGGAPVCLTNRLWGLQAHEVAEEVRWSVKGEIDAHEVA